jgi:hypothetical protein
MLVELDGIWARQMAALALGGHSSMYMEASETPLLWVCCEKQNGGRILVLRLLGLPGATCSPPSSAVWWVYARARHPKAAFGTASSDMQHRTACSGLVPTAVLPARPPADQRGRLGCQEHSRPCDAAWAALLPALRIGASACDM